MSATPKETKSPDATALIRCTGFVGLLLGTLTQFIQQILDALSSKRVPGSGLPSNARRLIIPKPIFVWWSLLVWVWALNVLFCQAQIGVPGCSETSRLGDFRSNLGALLPEPGQRLPVGLHQFMVVGGDNSIPQRFNHRLESSFVFGFPGFRCAFVGFTLASEGESMRGARHNPPTDERNENADSGKPKADINWPSWVWWRGWHWYHWVVYWLMIFLAASGARTYWHAWRHGVDIFAKPNSMFGTLV